MSVRHIFDVDWYLNLTLKKENLFTCCSSKIQSDGGTNYSSWLTVSSASVHQVLIGKWNQAMCRNMEIKFYTSFSQSGSYHCAANPGQSQSVTVHVHHGECFYLYLFWIFVKILARIFLKQYSRIIECVTQKDRQQLDSFKSLRKILNLESDGSNCWTFPLPWQVNSCQLASFCQLSSSCREHHLLHLFLFSKTHREGWRDGRL